MEFGISEVDKGINLVAGDVINMSLEKDEQSYCMIIYSDNIYKLLYLPSGRILKDDCVTINDIIEKYVHKYTEIIKSKDLVVSRIK